MSGSKISCLVGLIGLMLGACATADPAPARQAEPARDRVYVTNQDEATISVIDATEHEEIARIDLQELGFGPNAKPHHVVVEDDGSHFYVSLIGENTVLKLNREHEVAGRATFEVPGLLALHPAEDLLLVGRSMSAVDPPPSIGMIRRSTMETLDEVEVLYPRPHALTIRPGGDVAYSASLAVNQLAALDVAEETLELTLLEGTTHTLVQFAVSPDGQTLVATAQLTGQLLVFDLDDPMSPQPIESVAVEAAPWHPVFSPDGSMVWFGSKEADVVTAVNTETWTPEAVIGGRGMAQPHGAALSPDGRWLFVSNNNLEMDMAMSMADEEQGEHEASPGTVVVIDTENRRIVEVITVGLNPTGVGAASGR